MEAVIDKLDDVSGWTASGGAFVGLYESYDPGTRDDLTAGGNTASAWITFSDVGGGEVVAPNNFDLTGFEAIRFWSRSEYPGQGDNAWAFIVDLGFAEYYIPATRKMEAVTIYVPAGSTLTTFTIKQIGNQNDLIQISNLIAFKEEFPIDILEKIRDDIAELLPDGESLALVSGTSGDEMAGMTKTEDQRDIQTYNKIFIDGDPYLVKSCDGDVLRFFKEYSGDTLINTYAAAIARLGYAVEIGSESMTFKAPSIVVWELTNDDVPIDNKEGYHWSSFNKTTGNAIARRVGVNRVATYQIDCISDNDADLAVMEAVTRIFLDRQQMWIHNINVEFMQDGPSSRTDVSLDGQIPKKTYILKLDYEENLWPIQTKPIPAEMITNVTINPQ